MSTKQKIADTLRQHLADVADRGKLFGQALKVRADMAAIRRRLRTTYAELGEEVYRRLRDGDLDGDHRLLTIKERVDGLKTEVRQRESELRDIVNGGVRRDGASEVGQAASGDGHAP
jgi:hypothetical protein